MSRAYSHRLVSTVFVKWENKVKGVGRGKGVLTTPIIQHHQPKDMFLRVLGLEALSSREGLTDDDPQFELVV